MDCLALPRQPASGRFWRYSDRNTNQPFSPFPLTLKGTNQNSGRQFAGLTRSLLPQQWDSKGTSPFGRTPASRVQTFAQLPLRKETPSQPPENSDRRVLFFPYKIEITPAPKRLVAQRRRREGVCTLKRAHPPYLPHKPPPSPV